jgi:hypothetical protein
MIHTIDDAKNGIPKFWFALSMLNAVFIALFLFPFFKDEIGTVNILKIVALMAAVGFFVGLYIAFRSTLGSSFCFAMFCYFVTGFELLMAGGASGMFMHLSGHSEMKWLAFLTNMFCLGVTLFGGLYLEAKSLGLFDATQSGRWKKEIEKYIDYPSRKVLPALTNGQGLSQPQSNFFTSPYAFLAWGTSGIPLFFELYGGGKFNAIFFAAPLITAVLIYMNFRKFGPGLVRIHLLRKIEKSVGYRFINADLEQIQELRRTFFLSRWLMKDYVKPPSAAQVVQPSSR